MVTDKKVNRNNRCFPQSINKKMLKIHYPHKISNDDLYRRVQMEKWNNTIQQRRMRWLGHLLRLDQRTPASLAMIESKTKRGKHKQGNRITWMKVIEKDIARIKEKLQTEDINLQELAEDKREWSNMIRDVFNGAEFLPLRF